MYAIKEVAIRLVASDNTRLARNRLLTLPPAIADSIPEGLDINPRYANVMTENGQC